MEVFGDEYQVCPHCGYVVGKAAEEAIHMEPGTLLYDRYIIGKVLGYGGFGVTYVAWDGKLEQKVAIKEYLPGEFSTRMPGKSQITVFNGDKSQQFHDGLNKFVDEARRLAKFQNEQGIVKIFDSFKENDTAYIIMEYLDGETLSELLRRRGTIPEDEAVEMIQPILASLQTVHEEGLLHRDIAPDNIFLTKSGEVKLIDFGASRFATTSHSRSLTVIIKPGYSPEEQYRSRGDQGPHTDVYAIAATLYKMITGKTPPDAMERRAKYEGESKDILVEPHKLVKKLSVARENAILNAMNVRIEDRTPDVGVFAEELNADPPAKRIYGKIKKIDLYRWPLWLKVAVPTVLCAIIVFTSLLLTGVIDFSLFSEEIVIPENVVIVPDVEGEYTQDALKMIEDGKLLALTGGVVESQYIPAGKIILQNPVGGSYMNINGTVVLTVSSGKGVQEAVDGISTVPYIVWDSKEDGISKLLKAGLGQPNVEEAYDENVAEGMIISQSLDAGAQVDEGTIMTIVVSKGSKPFEMINVVGLDIVEAEELLTAKGLVVNRQFREDNTVKINTVLEQSVAQGEPVKRGQSITITIASEVKTIEVPNVVGMASKDAQEALKLAGFKVTVLENYDTNVEKGLVISQTPEGGTQSVKDTLITVYVSKGKQPITVTLDPNGGKLSKNTVNVYLGNTYGELPVPEYDGHEFVGWFPGESDLNGVTKDTVVETPSAHTLYAHWTAADYTVTLDANGGSSNVANIKVKQMQEYGALPVPYYHGYQFLGWYTQSSGGEEVTQHTVFNAAKNITLYARWSKSAYPLSFNGNGGQASTSEKLVEYMSAYGALPTATREGYTFTGWYTDAIGGSQVSESTVLNNAQSVTVYAHWSINSYTVTFYANGGKPETQTRSVNYNSSIGTLPSVSKDGHTFLGWFTSPNSDIQISDSTTLDVAGDIGYHAQWKANSYSVSFNSNGGSAASGITVTFDKPYGTLPTPTKPGHTFAGWTTESGDAVNETTTVETPNNHTLVAQWTANNYTVSFDTNDSAITVTYGEAYGTLPKPTKTGYEFVGWKLANGTPVNENTTVATDSNHTLKASWNGKEYTISFNANGGECSTSSKTVAYDSTYGTLPEPTRDYYTFKGWYTASSGGTPVTASTEFTNDGSVTLYAQWTENATSGWVSYSKVPSGAKIVNTRWAYTLREYKTSSASSLSGWTKYDTKKTWSNWSSWSTTDPTDGVKNVESRSVYDCTKWHYYRWIKRSGSSVWVYSWMVDSTYEIEETWTTYEMPVSETYAERHGYDPYVCYDGTDKVANLWIRADADSNTDGRYTNKDRTYEKDIYRTEWRYQDPVYTYHYYRDVAKGPVYTDPTGQANVSNIKKEVQYIPK